MKIQHITVLTAHHETRALFSCTKSLIHDKEISERVRVNIRNKASKDLNAFAFDSARPKIRRSQVYQDQLTSTYVQTVAQ